MGYGLIDTQNLTDIADAIRGKNGSSDTYKPNEMASAISNIPSGGSATLKRGVIRPDAELVKTYTFDKYLNADLGITIPAYTTTSTKLVDLQELSTYTCDWTNYNYFVLIRMATIPEYNISTVGKGRQEYALNSALYEITEVPKNTVHALADPTKYYTSDLRVLYGYAVMGRLIYYSSGTAIGSYNSAAYGYNQTVTTPFTSSTTITLKSPAFIVRGSTTYFTDTFMNAVTDVRYQYVIDVYRAPKGNLNLDGWGLATQWLKMNEDILSSSHKLT